MRISLVAFFAALIFNSSVWAAGQIQLNVGLSADELAMANKMSRIFSPFVFKLDRKLVTFHYQQTHTDDGFRPTDAKQLTELSTEWGKGFYHPEFTSLDMVGPGHYVATDATGSRSFGGMLDPQLYVVPVKSGTTMLDARRHISLKEKFLLELNQKLGCDNASAGLTQSLWKEPKANGQEVGSWIPVFRNSENLICRKIIAQALADLGIEAIIYGYTANELANCRHSRNEAISIISPTAIDSQNLSWFSHGRAIDPQGVGGFIKRLYEEGASDLSFGGSGPPAIDVIPIILTRLNSEPKEYEAWKAQHIFKCGAKWATETNKLSFQEVAYRLRDKEIAALKLSLKKALAIKAAAANGSAWFEIAMMRGLNRRISAAAGMDPSQFDTWVSAVKKYYTSAGVNGNQFGDTAVILGEDPQAFEKMKSIESEALLDAFLKAFSHYKTKPDKLFKWLRDLGAGPRVALLSSTMFISYASTIPILIGPIPVTPTKNYVPFLAKNRAIFVGYLQECLQQYQDPKVTLEQVQAGECGMISLVEDPS